MPAIKSQIDLAIFDLSYLLTFIYLAGFFFMDKNNLLIIFLPSFVYDNTFFFLRKL